MTTTGPPSPASFAGSDWGSGPRGGNPPPKNGPPGPSGYGGGGGGRANLPTPPVSGSSNGSMMNTGGPPPPGPGGPFGPMGGPPPRPDSRGPGAPRGGGPPGHPSPPQSLGRLSTSSNLSTRDPEAARRRQMMMEEGLFQHYNVLRSYLASDLKREAEGRSKNARDKLLRLSPIQFHELSTDIFDELRRRQNQHRAPPGTPNHLIPRENFHPKRNQARQKLSTLPETRFRDLAKDVFFELERRFPRFTGRPPNGMSPNGMGPNGMGPPSRTGTPMGFRGHTPRQDSLAGSITSPDGFAAQKSTQSNTIVPNKSYLVEDDDDGDMDSIYGGKRDTTKSLAGGKVIAEFQSKIDDLEGKVEALEVQIREKDEEIERQKSEGVPSEEAEELKRSLEDKLSGAQALNRELQEEIDNLRAEQERAQEQFAELSQQQSDAVALRTQHESLLNNHTDLKEAHDDLQKQHDSLQRQLSESSGGGEWRARCEDLEGENNQLRNSVQEQQRITTEVKTEAAGFLAEMKSIVEQSDQSYQREEKLSQRNSQLEKEIQEWKDRYARTKAQLRATKTASLGLEAEQPTVSQTMRAPNGLIKDTDITKFQVSIDDALKTARSGESPELLEKVKDVVAAVRPMVRVCAGVTDAKAMRARNKFTATINNFITAGKNFAQSGGISPVSLVDAAASHLSTAIVELATIVKIGPGDASDLGENAPAISSQSAPLQPAPLQPAPLRVQQPSASVQAQQQQQQQYDSSPYDDYADEDDDDEDDPTAGYYGETPVNGTPIEPAGELLPSTTYQLPSTTYQPQAAPARKPVGSAGKVQQPNGHQTEPDLNELKHFLDEQTSALITSIQFLVTSIRQPAPAQEVRERLATITSTGGGILQRCSDAVKGSSNAALNNEARPLLNTLEQSFSRLQAKESEGHNVEEGGPEWKKWCQSVPPIAFEMARNVKDLGGKVRDATAGDGEDFS